MAESQVANKSFCSVSRHYARAVNKFRKFSGDKEACRRNHVQPGPPVVLKCLHVTTRKAELNVRIKGSQEESAERGLFFT